MSTERHDSAWSEEDILQWILDERLRATTPRAELERDAEVAESLRGLEGFVAECRSSLSDEELIAASPRLEQEILAMTTREDLRLRVDLRLVGDFVHERLTRSLLLRVVAASLLLHIAALPVLAYFSFFQPPSQPLLITFENRDLKALPYSAADEVLEPEPIVTEPDIETDLAAVPGAGVLFAARLQAQGLANLDEQARPPFGQVVWGDELGLVLWTEHRLDQASREQPGSQELLSFALRNLSGLLSQDASRTPQALRTLAESAWLRAVREGRTSDLEPEFAIDPSRLQGARELRGDAWAEVYLEAAR